MEPWVEYEELVEHWDTYVDEDPTPDRYKERWLARLSHPSWEEKREALLWLCHHKCERCGCPTDLQVHHLHYDTLWYESHQDLELLCRPCHYTADRERAAQEVAKRDHWSLHSRAHAYMEVANRSSGQPDWPVSFAQALQHIQNEAP